MRIGQLEIRWLRPGRAPLDTVADLSHALAIPETNLIWLAVHQIINVEEKATIKAARTHTPNEHRCIADVGAGEGIDSVRQALIRARNEAIAEATKLRKRVA